jgi:thiosulfate dehydrogenase [quinone] large subunit
MNKLKEIALPFVLLVARIWLGIQWLEAGWHKIAGGQFDATGMLKGGLAQVGGEHPNVQVWYAWFLEHIALPNVNIINHIIPYAEVAVGLGLILGLFTTVALAGGAFMNLNFLLAGALSTNVVLYTLALILLVFIKYTKKFGGDGVIVKIKENKIRVKDQI